MSELSDNSLQMPNYDVTMKAKQPPNLLIDEESGDI